jgi:HD-GYP domain-containing protein (c-di-GMP phosphodiesterase class II)
MVSSGFFVPVPPKIEIFGEKLPKDKIAQELIKDIPVLIKPEIKYQAIQHVKKIVSEVRAGKLVNREEVKHVVEMLIKEVMDNYQNALINLIDIRNHDEYTFSHSINVCVLAILIGIKKCMEKEELEKLGLGAMLHDLGKIRITSEILAKPGKLTEEEFETVKKHPIYGYEILCHDEEIGVTPREIVYQHHEQYNGEGYPRGLKGEEIHEYAVITTLADVYDALTTDRPYRKKFLPHDAMRLIITETETKFSKEVIRLFLEYMSIYPIGSLVKLSSGEVGIVVKAHKDTLIRPTVRLILNPRGDYYPEPYEVDLRKDKKRFIIGPVGDEVFRNITK